MWVYIDPQGRNIIGRVISEDKDRKLVTLADPFIMVESPGKTKGAVNLNFLPFLHTIDIKTIMVYWTHAFEPPQEITDRYKDILTHIQAKRSNIQLVSKMPERLSN